MKFQLDIGNFISPVLISITTFYYFLMPLLLRKISNLLIQLEKFKKCRL